MRTACFSMDSAVFTSTPRWRPPTSRFESSFFGARPSFRLHCEQQQKRKRFQFRVFALTSNDFKNGLEVEIDNAPWKIVEFLHVKPGKGAAFVRTKLKNCISGTTIERTFRAGEAVEPATVEKSTKQFTYRDGEQFVFMDMSTYEEARLGEKEVGDTAKWLREGMDCTVITWKDQILSVDLPANNQYKVVRTDAQTSGSLKPAVLDTGASVNVPLFINDGEDIIVDVRTGTYVGRAKDIKKK